MRAEKLTLSAFGPYSQPTEIELFRLGNGGVYLITGDTGSGKTTIFDAITYALYGEASGNDREVNMLRSNNAPFDLPTEVKLEFSVNGKSYTVKRNPEYERKKTRGEGVTREKANAELIFPDGRVITKIKDVDAAIVDILGIDRNQFKRIAMLAQGQFVDFLFADTESRIAIFRKLFDTELYRGIQQQLKSEERQLYQKYENHSISLKSTYDRIVCSYSDLSLKENAAKSGELLSAEVISLLEDIISRDKDIESELDKELSECYDKNKSINELLSLATVRETANKNILNAQSLLKTKTEELKSLTLKLDEIKPGENKAELNSAEIVKIESSLNFYTELAELKKSIILANNDLEKVESSLIKSNQSKEDLALSCEKIKNALLKLEEDSKSLAELRVSVTSLSAALKQYESAECLKKELDKSEKSYNSELEKYKSATDTANVKQDRFIKLKNTYFDMQAGILASTLECGKPCPVCGSVTHPSLARMPLDAPDKAALDEAEAAYKAAEELRHLLSERCATVLGEINTIKKSLSDRLSELGINSDRIGSEYYDSKAKVVDELNRDKTGLAFLEAQIEKKGELEKNLKTYSETIEATAKKIAELEKEKARLNEQIISRTEREKSISKGLSFNSLEQAQNRINSLQRENEGIKSAISSVEKRIKEVDAGILLLKGNIESEQKTVSNTPKVDKDALLKEQAELKLKIDELTEKSKALHLAISVNSDCKDSILKKQSEIDAIEKEYSLIKELSDTANGTIPGKYKIGLEAFVLGRYFDKVIIRANRRLLIMSDGRYELARSRVGVGRVSQTGLDINVIDHYLGGERSVKSLSGGESFMASLALALGLSDYICESSGGIRLESMFVDEGFGTLDTDTLDMAIKVLLSLAEGDRLVGIISHVSLLNDKIDKKILVKKSKNGSSTVKIEV